MIPHTLLLLLVSLLLAGCAATPCERARAVHAACALPAPSGDVEPLDSCASSSERAASCALAHPDAYCAFVESPHSQRPEQNAYLTCLATP